MKEVAKDKFSDGAREEEISGVPRLRWEDPKKTKNPLPATGFLRLQQIIGDKKKGIAAIIPVSKSTWWEGIKDGRYPEGVLLSQRCRAWRVEEIMALIDRMAGGS